MTFVFVMALIVSGAIITFPVSAAPGDELLKLLPADGESLDLFGSALAVDGTTAVIGAHLPTGTYWGSPTEPVSGVQSSGP